MGPMSYKDPDAKKWDTSLEEDLSWWLGQVQQVITRIAYSLFYLGHLLLCTVRRAIVLLSFMT